MTHHQYHIDLFQHIFESSSQAILVLNAKKRITKANTAAQSLFGYSKEELINSSVILFIPELATAITEDNSTELSEIWINKKDGSQSSIALKANKISFEGIEHTILYVIDKTDRLIYQWALKGNQKKLSLVESEGKLGNWYWVFKTDERYWSDEFYRICGLPPGDDRLNAKTALSFIHPDDKERAIQVVTNTIEKRIPYHIEKRIIQLNGTIRNVIASGKVDYNAKGEAFRISGTMRDITAQKNIELQLHHSEDRSKALLEAIPDMIFVQDKRGTIVEYHAQDLKKLLVSTDQIIGSNIKEIFPPEVYTLINTAQQNVFQSKKLQIVHYIVIENGNPAHYEARIILINNQNVLTIIRDVSERKVMEEALKKSQEQLAAYSEELEKIVAKRTNELTSTVQKLVETNISLEDQIQETAEAEKIAISSSSLSSAIAKNFPNGFIIVFNSGFEIVLNEGEAITQLRLNRIVSEGMHVNDIPIFSEVQKETLKKQILQTLKGKHLRFEMEYKKRFFSVNTKPLLDGNNAISTALFVYNDITFQKNTERKAQNALLKEQELNELKSRFISMASHEFRTPLSAIQTSAILIGRQNEPGKEEKREKYVGQIKNNVKNLIIILNDFLSLSKLEEGKVIPHNEKLNIIDFSKKIIQEIQITKKKGQHIVLSVTKSSVFLKLDPKLVRHILMNLLSNAIKYSDESSTIYVNIHEDKTKVTLVVKDEGIGIPIEEQDKLFERFFRANNVNNIEGTGIGLNIVKQYVTLLGGTIKVTSKPNKGSTFTVTWPKPTHT